MSIANLALQRYWPCITLYSKRLIKLMECILDYYPDLGYYDFYTSTVKDTIVEMMYCYAELKEYFYSYFYKLSKDEQSDPKLDIGSCGDEDIADELHARLDFGRLDMSKKPCDEATAYDLAVLLRLLAPMYRVKAVPSLSSILLDAKPMVKYETLWLLFKPGTYVYAQQSAFVTNVIEGYSSFARKRPRGTSPVTEDDGFSAWVVGGWKYLEKEPKTTSDDPDEWYDRLELTLWNVQYDGNVFERLARQLLIFLFDGYKYVMDLQVIPADIYDKSDGGQLRKKLEKRGKRTLSMVQEPGAHRLYDHIRSGYQGQIIVDPAAYRQYAREMDPRTQVIVVHTPVVDHGGGRFNDIAKAMPLTSENLERVKKYSILFPQRIEGFGLKTKKWMVFEIDNISDKAPLPVPNQLDSDLVLVSEADKDSLRTILPKGEHSTAVSTDIVQGKGEGKIFLLYGPPGTGKTLTVECVANDTCRPLLTLTAQDLGLETDVENHLRTFFTLAAKWSAILLVDEADLFLEQRKAGDLDRNSLSIVFLRTMEYYKGVLFLTTNRPGHIDDSFISRITCPIAYHELSQETKVKIIRKFVKKFEKTRTISVDSRAMKYLEAHCQDLNGRQIRNVMQNAVAGAEIGQRQERTHNAQHGRGEEAEAEEDEGQGLVTVEMHHVKAAVERQQEFRDYLKDLRGRDEASRARSKQDYIASPRGSI